MVIAMLLTWGDNQPDLFKRREDNDGESEKNRKYNTFADYVKTTISGLIFITVIVLGNMGD